MNDMASTQPLPASQITTPVIRRMVLVNPRAINDITVGNAYVNDGRLGLKATNEAIRCQCNSVDTDGENMVSS